MNDDKARLEAADNAGARSIVDTLPAGLDTQLMAEEGTSARLFRLQAKGYADEVLAP